MSLEICPMPLDEAYAFIAVHHRHHGPPQGAKFAIGCMDLKQGCIAGVAVVGRPVARLLQNDWTLEVTRTCSAGGFNVNSFLYGACWRAARALGYKKLITYTLQEESGASLRGAGWKCLGEAGGGSWNRKTRPRVDKHPLQCKLRWEKEDKGFTLTLSNQMRTFYDFPEELKKQYARKKSIAIVKISRAAKPST